MYTLQIFTCKDSTASQLNEDKMKGLRSAYTCILQDLNKKHSRILPENDSTADNVVMMEMANSHTQENFQSQDGNEQRHLQQATIQPETMVEGCIELGLFAKWREGREWLAVAADRSVQCTACSDIRD